MKWHSSCDRLYIWADAHILHSLCMGSRYTLMPILSTLHVWGFMYGLYVWADAHVIHVYRSGLMPIPSTLYIWALCMGSMYGLMPISSMSIYMGGCPYHPHIRMYMYGFRKYTCTSSFRWFGRKRALYCRSLSAKSAYNVGLFLPKEQCTFRCHVFLDAMQVSFRTNELACVACICVLWLIHARHMTYARVWHDTLTWVTWLVQLRDTRVHTRCCNTWVPFVAANICETWLVYTCDMTHPHVCIQAATHQQHTIRCGLHTHVRHESLIYESWPKKKKKCRKTRAASVVA